MEDEDSADEEFWNQDFFAEDKADDEYKTESSSEDEADTDFSEEVHRAVMKPTAIDLWTHLCCDTSFDPYSVEIGCLPRSFLLSILKLTVFTRLMKSPF